MTNLAAEVLVGRKKYCRPLPRKQTVENLEDEFVKTIKFQLYVKKQSCAKDNRFALVCILIIVPSASRHNTRGKRPLDYYFSDCLNTQLTQKAKQHLCRWRDHHYGTSAVGSTGFHFKMDFLVDWISGKTTTRRSIDRSTRSIHHRYGLSQLRFTLPMLHSREPP